MNINADYTYISDESIIRLGQQLQLMLLCNDCVGGLAHKYGHLIAELLVERLRLQFGQVEQPL